jgi:diadenosine tetraphosphate (Ap4A) HIT family hydrolase
MDRAAWQALVDGAGCQMDAPRPESNEHADLVAPFSVSSLYLAKNQTYRGQCVLIFDLRHAARPDQLTPDEWAAFCADLYRAQNAVVSVTKPDHVNVESLGNVVPHLHWHTSRAMLATRGGGCRSGRRRSRQCQTRASTTATRRHSFASSVKSSLLAEPGLHSSPTFGQTNLERWSPSIAGARGPRPYILVRHMGQSSADAVPLVATVCRRPGADARRDPVDAAVRDRAGRGSCSTPSPANPSWDCFQPTVWDFRIPVVLGASGFALMLAAVVRMRRVN